MTWLVAPPVDHNLLSLAKFVYQVSAYIRISFAWNARGKSSISSEMVRSMYMSPSSSSSTADNLLWGPAFSMVKNISEATVTTQPNHPWVASKGDLMIILKHKFFVKGPCVPRTILERLRGPKPLMLLFVCSAILAMPYAKRWFQSCPTSIFP